MLGSKVVQIVINEWDIQKQMENANEWDCLKQNRFCVILFHGF